MIVFTEIHNVKHSALNVMFSSNLSPLVWVLFVTYSFIYLPLSFSFFQLFLRKVEFDVEWTFCLHVHEQVMYSKCPYSANHKFNVITFKTLVAPFKEKGKTTSVFMWYYKIQQVANHIYDEN